MVRKKEVELLMMHQVERRTLDGRACTFWIPEGRDLFLPYAFVQGKKRVWLFPYWMLRVLRRFTIM